MNGALHTCAYKGSRGSDEARNVTSLICKLLENLRNSFANSEFWAVEDPFIITLVFVFRNTQTLDLFVTFNENKLETVAHEIILMQI